MAILDQAIIANFYKIAVMAILVWVEMATNMVNMGVSAKIACKSGLEKSHRLKSYG